MAPLAIDPRRAVGADRSRLHALAAAQHGLVTVRQARDLGFSRAAIRHLVARGDWIAVSRRVLRAASAPVTTSQAALAGVLDVGPRALVAAESAAAMWGVAGFTVLPLHLIVVRGGSETATELATIHRPRHLPDPFAAVLDSVPLVRPSLVLLELAAKVHPDRLARIFDRLWSLRLISAPSVRREIGPLLTRGRAGSAAMRELLDGFPDDYVPAASGLEHRADEVLTRAGLGPFRRQVDLGDDEVWCGRVDLRHERLPVVVEVDSEMYHSALSDAAHDAAREQRLRSAGFEVTRVTDLQVWHRPAEAVAAVRVAIARARERTGRW